MTKSRIFAWFGLLLAYLIIAVAIFRCLDEDAFISFRYIDQLCAGNGLVFNQGIKVEGFSNFLWIVLLLPFRAMGGSLIICSRLLGMFFCAGTAVLIILFTKKITSQESLLPYFAGCWYIVSIPVLWWSQSGLETSLASFTLLCAIYFTLFSSGSLLWGGIFMAASSLCRPELQAFLPLYFLWIFLIRPDKRSITTIAVLSGFILAIYLLRYLYFGHFLPTPYYIKVTGKFTEGLSYVKDFFLAGHYFWALPFFVTALFEKKHRFATLPLACVVLCYLFFNLYVGGDYKPHFRFAVPFIAPFIIVSVSGVYAIGNLCNHKTKRVYMYFPVSLFIVCTLLFYADPQKEPAPSRLMITGGLSKFKDTINHQLTTYRTNYDISYMPYLGLWLKENFSFDTTIVYGQLGQVPFFSGNKYYFIDTFGLMDRKIASLYKKGRQPAWSNFFSQMLGREQGEHQAEDDTHREIARYVLSKQPDIIMVLGFLSHWLPWVYLWDEPSFKDTYVLKQVFGFRSGTCRKGHNCTIFNTLLFFRRDMEAPPECTFKGVSHNRFYHYTKPDEVREWLQERLPYALALTY